MLDISYFSKQGTNQLNGEAILHLHSEDTNLFAIAEGVGGQLEKNLSANFSLAILQKLFQENDKISMSDIFKNLSLELKKTSHRLNNYSELKTMLTICIIKKNTVHIGHIGNSRVYHVSDHRIAIKTKDQSNLQKFIKNDIIDKNILKPVISGNNNYTIEQLSFPFEKGEKILLLSDGIYNSITEINDLLKLVSTSNNIKTLAFKIQQVIEFYEIEDDYSSICIEAV